MGSPRVPPLVDRELKQCETQPKRQFYLTCEDELAATEMSFLDCLQQQSDKKRKLTMDQVATLEAIFERGNKLDTERKSQIAVQLGLPQRQVAIWFQNRRARSKNKQLQLDYDSLKAKYDDMVKQNDKLHEEIIRLATLLEGASKYHHQLINNDGTKVGLKMDLLTEAPNTPIEDDLYGTPTTIYESEFSASPLPITNIFQIDEGIATSTMVAPKEFTLNPFLLHQIALKLEDGCTQDDCSILFAHWD